MTDAILLLCHMGDVVNYELLKVARTKPSGTDWAFDFMSDVRDMQRAAIEGAETRVRNAMLKDGSTALAEATALRTSFDGSRAELLARREFGQACRDLHDGCNAGTVEIVPAYAICE